MIYFFRTTATMKPYNNKKWWINSDIIPDMEIDADSRNEALKQYQRIVRDRHYIEISDNALKTKNPMFIDTPDGDPKQIGYVITAKTDFDNDRRGWVTQYIELWVHISILENAF